MAAELHEQGPEQWFSIGLASVPPPTCLEPREPLALSWQLSGQRWKVHSRMGFRAWRVLLRRTIGAGPVCSCLKLAFEAAAQMLPLRAWSTPQRGGERLPYPADWRLVPLLSGNPQLPYGSDLQSAHPWAATRQRGFGLRDRRSYGRISLCQLAAPAARGLGNVSLSDRVAWLIAEKLRGEIESVSGPGAPGHCCLLGKGKEEKSVSRRSFLAYVLCATRSPCLEAEGLSSAVLPPCEVRNWDVHSEKNKAPAALRILTTKPERHSAVPRSAR